MNICTNASLSFVMSQSLHSCVFINDIVSAFYSKTVNVFLATCPANLTVSLNMSSIRLLYFIKLAA